MPLCRHSLLPLLLCTLTVGAQDTLSWPAAWWATVDEQQRVVLQWNVSPSPTAAGYHICSGLPCEDYATVQGRLDTTLVCSDHMPTAEHTYRLHVFDTLGNVTPLTPPFGNMVLQAEIPACETHVVASWTPYRGAPVQVHYSLLGRCEPVDTAYTILYSTSDTTALRFQFDLPEEVIQASLRVMASASNLFRSYSNTASAMRQTTASAQAVEIAAIEYDSVHTAVRLELEMDTAFPYRLYRSVDGTPWSLVAEIQPTTQSQVFVDSDINPYDSLHCYQLEVRDACGLNPRYSATTCLVVPTPPPPSAFFPNMLLVGDERNGEFRPVMRGLRGDLYELNIYNRQGQVVFTTTDDHAAWHPDHTTPQGTYTYHLRCRFNNNTVRTYYGTVTVVY